MGTTLLSCPFFVIVRSSLAVAGLFMANGIALRFPSATTLQSLMPNFTMLSCSIPSGIKSLSVSVTVLSIDWRM